MPGGSEVDPDTARSAAELVVRLVLSLALSPDSALGIESDEGARDLARRYLVPGLHMPRSGDRPGIPATQ